MKRPIREYRVLSLVSSSVLLLSFALTFYAVATRTLNPLVSLLNDYWIPLIFVPAVLPCFALLRLAHLRLATKVHIPFFDGWFIHVVILTSYAIVILATYPLWKMA